MSQLGINMTLTPAGAYSEMMDMDFGNGQLRGRVSTKSIIMLNCTPSLRDMNNPVSGKFAHVMVKNLLRR